MLNVNIANKARVLMQFFAAQGITMAANLLYGLLCVRLLPASEYAKFVVVFAVQGTLLILMDANFSGTLIPLIGERVHNLQLVADYVASLRYIVVRAYVVIGVAAIFLYPYLVKNRGWDWKTVAAMVAILLLSTWCMRVSTVDGAVMIMLRDRGIWYRGQIISSVGTLLLLGFFWSLGWLGAFAAILINVAGIVFVAAFYRKRVKTLIGVTGQPTVEKRRAIFRLALPNVPQSFFYAIQGQIPLFLITYLGRTKGVASVGALGRLAQIFAIFMQANSLLVEPYFAKLPKERLKRDYPIALLMTAIISITGMLVALWFPQALLWVLGPQYSGLTYEVKLVIGAGAISCLSAVLWGIHSARRFVYWWNVGLSIGLTFLAQLLFILNVDMSTIRGVLWMNIATNTVSLFVNILSGIWGFTKGPREAEIPSVTIVPETSIEAEATLEMDAVQNRSLPGKTPPRLSRPEVIDG